MARIAILVAMTLLLAVGALFMLREWDLNHRFYRADLWTKVHFQLHRQAFERLGQQFESDPLLAGVSYTPPRWRLEPAEISLEYLTPEEREKAQEELAQIKLQRARYEPFLKDLRFPGGIRFYPEGIAWSGEPRTRPEPFDEPTEVDMRSALVYISDDGAVIEEALFILYKDVDFVTPCPRNPRPYHFMDCLNPLGGNWWMRHQWEYQPMRPYIEPSSD